MIPNKLSETIQTERRGAGLSQSELAERVGSSQSQISRLEKGQSSVVSDSVLRQILEFLEIDVSALEETTNEMATPLVLAYCTNGGCVKATPFANGMDLGIRPHFLEANQLQAHCPYCSAGLGFTCPNPECNAPLNSGISFCASCGIRYVRPTEELLEIFEQDGRAGLIRYVRDNREMLEFRAFERHETASGTVTKTDAPEEVGQQATSSEGSA
jgi:transcriptional regulator with XRE-family HTH domain